jgi:predicted RND superfamily exporter protein
MARAARLLIRWWPLFVGALLLLSGLAAWRALRLEFDFAFRHFFLAEAEDELAAEMRARFGENAGSYLVAVLRGTDVFGPESLAAIAAMSDAVALIPHVDQVWSLATVPFIRGDGQELSLTPIAGLVAEGVDPARLRAEVLASPLYAQRLVSRDAAKTVVVALVDPEHRSIPERAPTIAAFEQAIRDRLPPGFTALFTGYPVTEAEYARTVLLGFGTAQAVGLVLMALSLYATFRTVPAVVLPLVTVGIATVLVMGMIQLSGQRLTFTNASVPLMMLVIGVAEVSFFVSRFYEEAVEGWDAELPVRAVASALWPGFIASMTTSAGFFALGSGHIGLTREFGFNMSIASLVTFAAAAMLIPGALARLGAPPARALRAIEGGGVTRFIATVTSVALARPRLVVGAAVAIVVLGAIGASRITLDQYATRELTGEHEILVAQRVVDTELAGAFQTHVVVVDPKGGPVITPERLRDIESLQAFLATQPDVVKTWSVVDYVKELHHAIGGPGAARRLPESAEQVAQYLLLLSSGGSTSDLATLVDPTGRFASVVLGTTDLGTDTLRTLRRRADAFVAERLGGRLDLRFVGDYWEVSRGNSILAADQLQMTLGSVLLILPLAGLFLRSVRLTLLCLPPNFLPVAALGLMGFAGFPLRTGTSIVIPVTIGIAIDMTTHYLTRAREEWERDGDYPGAVRRALAGTGWSMTSSTLALVVGFVAYQVVPFQSFNDVGILASWTLTVALAANLFLTPLLVLWTHPFGEPAPSTVARRGGEATRHLGVGS